jgi:hypothetical protein
LNPVTPQEIKLPERWEESSAERGSENDPGAKAIQYKLVRDRFNEIRLTIGLPENSEKGKYIVQLRPATLANCIFCSRPLKSNGRTLFVKLPLQRVDPGTYMLLVERESDLGDEYIGHFSLLVENPDHSRQDGTKDAR